jgi:Asp-tRNA(Asn)/Glu-tRNA(Gln) amidotransferase A subunit family amidase
MSGFAEYDRYDAVGLAELVRKREVSAAELLAEARHRCDRVNPRLNAVVYRLDAEAERAASAVDTDRPFTGVPFLVKDLGAPLAGAPFTCGSRLFANYVPEEDGEIIKRFKAAGLVTFGKTNVPEIGLVPFTEPELFGPCRNPWNLDRTPGGSSGGAASAVAAGIVPMAHASDGGGSIRIPASCCGLVGLKTSRGLNPRDPQTETIISDFGVDHVVSRTVRDSAAALDAVCNRLNAGFQSGLEVPPQSLKVAVVRSAMFGPSVAPEVRAALDSAVRLMESLGHHLEDAEPRVDYAEFGMAFLTYWAISAQEVLNNAAELLGHSVLRQDVELSTWTLASVGGVVPDAEKAWAKAVIERATKVFLEFSKNYDVIMSPVLGSLPLHIGQNSPSSSEKVAMRVVDGLHSPWLMKAVMRAIAAKSFAFAPFTAQFNMTGQPAISVPLAWSPDGLPIGIQFAGKLNADGLLLRLARQLELAQAWAYRRPPLWSGENVPEAA